MTGGTGFIDSHTAVELFQMGCEVVIADDLSNSSAIDPIERITGKRTGFSRQVWRTAMRLQHSGYKVFNLGTGEGHSVLGFVHTFKRVNNLTIPCESVPHRARDIATSALTPSRPRVLAGKRRRC